MEPTLEIGQRVLVNRIGNHFSDPQVGDIVVFHPPAGAETRHVRRPPAAPTAPACDRPTPEQASVNFIKRVVAGPGDTIRDHRRPRDPQRQAREGPVHLEHVREQREPRMHAPDADHDSARALVHDGRQPWGVRRQPVLGPRPPRSGSSGGPSPPTGPPTASGSSEEPAGSQASAREAHGPAGGSSSSTAASASAGSPAPTRPAAAASPDRSSPPRCCSTSSALGAARGPRAERAQRLQAARPPRRREELYPLVLRTAAQGRRRLALRARHRRPRPAPHEPRRAARRAARRRAARRALPHRRLPGARLRLRAARDRRRRRDERGDRRRLDRRQGHARPLHAPRRRAAPGLGVRDARRLLHARAPRRDPAPRRLAAAPALVPDAWPTSSSRSSVAPAIRTPPRGGRGATRRPRASITTPIASKRSSVARGRSCASGEVRRGHPPHLRALALVQRVPRAAPAPLARRVLTSTNTSVVPSWTIRSISPQRVRWLRATSSKPSRSRCASGEVLAGAAEVLSGVGGHGRRR